MASRSSGGDDALKEDKTRIHGTTVSSEVTPRSCKADLINCSNWPAKLRTLDMLVHHTRHGSSLSTSFFASMYSSIMQPLLLQRINIGGGEGCEGKKLHGTAGILVRVNGVVSHSQRPRLPLEPPGGFLLANFNYICCVLGSTR